MLKIRFALAASLSAVLLAFVSTTPLRPASAVNAAAQSASQYQYPFQNPELPAEERITNLLSLMTIEEKVECLGTDPSVPRLGVKGAGHMEGIHGLTAGGPAKWGGEVTVPTTTFPQGYGLGETWDAEIIRQAAAVEGYEARYLFQTAKYNKTRSGLVIRSPNADLGRDPRWGRTEECYGEDPHLNGTLAAAFVRGLQGDHPKYWQAASLLKHFLANSNENTRASSSSDFDERLFREYYSVPFRAGIMEGGARAFMASYNAVNGTPMHVNPILKNVAVGEWGEDGIICTDGGGMRLLVTGHKRFPDFARASAAVIKAGIGQFLDDYREPVHEALKNNLLTEGDVDKVLRNTFRVMIKLGQLDPPALVPYASIKDAGDPWLTEKHKSLARLVTQKSIVLLKNEKNTLPLDRGRLKSIAVIGPRADEVLLDWYSGTPPYTVTPLQGIRDKVGPGVEVRYAADNRDGEAARAARSSDVAIVVVGNHPTCAAGWAQCPVASDGKEAVDRRSITLEQEELVKQVFEANPRTIVVLRASFPYAINWTQGNVPAIVHLTNNSQEEGNALADVLFGDYNPAGRLVQTWPRALEQLPPMLDYDIRHGRTYMYFKGEPLYPFGFGLSYTTFAYSNLRAPVIIPTDGSITVSVDVKNTGGRAGEEVVQMYLKHLDSKVARPLKELKGFARVALKPGESKTVRLTLKGEQLAYWNAGERRFVPEGETVQIMVGSSSADIRLDKNARVLTNVRVIR
ncbi:MAG TPA: glycoside hydrolase family 3 C-terminal domain-containing protein [Pyrinomonadaceae bacterium]|nr:glycoside hydrolase family 3 C-terminal domain-containing protein [Pyrinomonadaceae bacterium]